VPAGAKIEVRLPEGAGPPVPQPELPLAVVHEDAWLLAVDKPAGQLCHPLEAGERDTLANAVVARFPECAEASDAAREGGLCQRLDRETSGLVLVARHREAWTAVRALLQAGRVEKVYLALVRGETPDAGRCDLPLSQRGTAPPRAVSKPDAKAKSVRPARTRFVTLGRSTSFSLLEVWIESGVRYQIRAHLAALGFPLVGDPIYGGGEPPGSLGRHLLHAWKLGFTHPGTGATLRLQAAPPPDAVRCLAQLGLPL
jgi:23S rRNA pseudouridine1911/1915/1917 synthase